MATSNLSKFPSETCFCFWTLWSRNTHPHVWTVLELWSKVQTLRAQTLEYFGHPSPKRLQSHTQKEHLLIYFASGLSIIKKKKRCHFLDSFCRAAELQNGIFLDSQCLNKDILWNAISIFIYIYVLHHQKKLIEYVRKIQMTILIRVGF